MTALRKTLALVSEDGRRELYALVAVMTLGSLLEALGIGLILPYLNAVTTPQEFLDHRLVGPIFREIGITRPRQVLVYSSLGIVVAFIGKNAYVAWMWNRVYTFLFQQFRYLSRELLQGYLSVPYTFHLQRNTAELIRNTTNETRRVLTGAVQSTLEIFSEVLVIVGIVAILAYAQTLAAGVVFGVLALGGWGLTSYYRSRLQEIGDTRAKHMSRMIQTVNESLGPLKEVKLLGREQEFVKEFDRSARAMGASERDRRVIGQYPRLLLETGTVVGMVGLAALLVFTGVSLLDAIPVLGLFAVAAVRLMPSVSRVVDKLNGLRYEAAAIDIVHDELEALARKQKRSAATSRSQDVRTLIDWETIEVRDLIYRYPEADEKALRGISFSIERGTHIGVVGSSGAGKTTLVDLLLGLLEADAGEIFVGDVSIQENLGAWQRKIGYIPQEIFLTDDTIRSNVAFGLPPGEVSEARVWNALEAAQLKEFVASQTNGLDTVVGERGVRISGGQRQRIGVARALYHDPELLVLDEATSSLDYETERKVAMAVDALSGEKTVVTVTHRLNSVRSCDAIHLLRDGRLAASGTYGDLRETSAEFKRMLRADDYSS